MVTCSLLTLKVAIVTILSHSFINLTHANFYAWLKQDTINPLILI